MYDNTKEKQQPGFCYLNARALLIALILLTVSAACWSHSGSTAYIQVDSITADKLSGELLLPLIDLELVLGIDSNADNRITANELIDQQWRLDDYARQHVNVDGQGEQCAALWQPPTSVKLGSTVYQRWIFSFNCKAGQSPTTLSYSALFEQDTQHRAITFLSKNGQAKTQHITVLSPQNRNIQLTEPASTLSAFAAMFKEGTVHVLGGYDHMLFLLALIAASLLANPGKLQTLRWAVTLTAIISGFTLGHSVTLCIAALSGWSPPSQWVELAIAATVIAAGFNIAIPLFREAAWKIAISFGLIHGFGFASAVGELAPEEGLTLGPLLAFNLGVEAGQLFVLVLCCPLLWLLSHFPRLAQIARPGVAVATIAAGTFWSAQLLHN